MMNSLLPNRIDEPGSIKTLPPISLRQKIFIEAYYMATLPFRNYWLNRLASKNQRPIPVLFYHCVSPKVTNSWTVQPDIFQKQIDWLQRNFELISLEETQNRMANGNSSPALAITFDDGYAENQERAIPILLERKIPFTYFVTLSHLQTGEPFSHDLAIGSPRPVDNIDQIARMAEAGVEIGGHGRHHIDMSKIKDTDRLWDEIVTSAEDLGQQIGQKIRRFAFPFGLIENMSPSGFAICREAGIVGVASAYGGYNSPGDDSFHIRRFAVDNNLARLKNRAVIDFRHMNDPNYDWQSDAPTESLRPQDKPTPELSTAE
jgi:peptidoglycan/xylan/chitin deacetylase (PgdA/CDA1 family)